MYNLPPQFNNFKITVPNTANISATPAIEEKNPAEDSKEAKRKTALIVGTIGALAITGAAIYLIKKHKTPSVEPPKTPPANPNPTPAPAPSPAPPKPVDTPPATPASPADILPAAPCGDIRIPITEPNPVIQVPLQASEDIAEEATQQASNTTGYLEDQLSRLKPDIKARYEKAIEEMPEGAKEIYDEAVDFTREAKDNIDEILSRIKAKYEEAVDIFKKAKKEDIMGFKLNETEAGAEITEFMEDNQTVLRKFNFVKDENGQYVPNVIVDNIRQNAEIPDEIITNRYQYISKDNFNYSENLHIPKGEDLFAEGMFKHDKYLAQDEYLQSYATGLSNPSSCKKRVYLQPDDGIWYQKDVVDDMAAKEFCSNPSYNTDFINYIEDGEQIWTR